MRSRLELKASSAPGIHPVDRTLSERARQTLEENPLLAAGGPRTSTPGHGIRRCDVASVVLACHTQQRQTRPRPRRVNAMKRTARVSSRNRPIVGSPITLVLLLLATCALIACTDEAGGDTATDTSCPPGEERVTNASGERVCAPVGGADTRDDEDTRDDVATDTGSADTEDTQPQSDTGTDTGAQSDTATPDTGSADTGAADTGSSDTGVGDVSDTSGDADGMSMNDTVRFVAIGDVGEGSAEQYHVADSIGVVCGQLGGCDFGLLLGDNFYDSGVDSEMDPMFDTHFAQPYGPLGFPFYVVLGNHDLGGDGLGIDLDFQKGNYQVAYSMYNSQWRMPAKHYEFTEGPIWFAALNTTDIFFNQDDDQYSAVNGWLADYDARGDTRWKIAFGHHPYISNGPHGNAGDYEDLGGVPLTEIPRGDHVLDFFNDNVCGKFDVYICGHDHSRQDLQATCGTEFIVSGAGAKTTELDNDNPSHFQADTTGFLVVDASDDALDVAFYDRDGVLEHERTITR